MTIKILIGADICPTPSNYNLFANAQTDALVGTELAHLLNEADYTIFNLETPLTDEQTPIAKYGRCLCAPSRVIKGLKTINPHFFTLANNHILDQGPQGLSSTVSLLKQAKIAYAGIGKNLSKISQTHVVSIKGIKIGIYCCAEHEFSIATENSAGVNPYDPLVSFDTVRELKAACDMVIVLYHGGKEFYRYPSPQLQRVFRKFAQCGADLVIAQHTHCIGCQEVYQGATLIYGQGNFLFDGADNEYWQTSLLVQLEIDENSKKASVKWIVCVKTGAGVRAASTQQAQEILKGFELRSQQIQMPGFIQQEYEKFAAAHLNGYLHNSSGLLGRNLITRIFNKLTHRYLFAWLYTKKDFIRIQNILECEAHSELFLTGIKQKKNK